MSAFDPEQTLLPIGNNLSQGAFFDLICPFARPTPASRIQLQPCEILEQPNLSYMKETIFEAYEEYFDA
jgi:hypothetical protein